MSRPPGFSYIFMDFPYAQFAAPLFWLRTTVTVFFSSTVRGLVVSKLLGGHSSSCQLTIQGTLQITCLEFISNAWKRIKNVNLAPCSLIQGRSTKSRDCYFYSTGTFMEMSSFSSGRPKQICFHVAFLGGYMFLWNFLRSFPVNHRAGLCTSC